MGLKSLMGQFLKFGVVGVIAFVIDYAVLMLLSQVVGWDPVVSSAISFTLSVVFNYVASMRYVFTRREDLSREREFVIFVVLSIVGLGINSAIIWAGTQAFGGGALAVTITKVVATVVVALWNFWSRKRWLEAK
ncbi:GtrA family protein [Olsenella sp. SW781]|uniref:GtrA family protein n=1 Tax=Olsenella sp. SW781 TaxID=2530046 RepID=UPI00143C39C9|nr:GtrA family protein [Olsenella sp. SW781]NJE80131.1 GtrA family protein [Olsenella sp. SW781]